MKKTLLAFALLVIFFKTHGQVSFSCTHREMCVWNEDTKKYANCSGYDESSLFVMTKSENMFTHTIEDLKSTYYIDGKEYDKQNDVYTYSVTSDVGNKYFYVFDPKNKEVRAVFARDGKTMMIVFTVKAIF